MTPFLTRLRALDGAASKAPWVVVDYDAPGGGEIHCPPDPDGENTATSEFVAHADAPNDAALIVALRNRAARIAALVEAADRVARYFDPTDGGQGCLDEDGKRLAAALAALAKEEA